MTSGLSAAATAWMDLAWDPDAGLLWNMEGSFDELVPPRTLHLVPQSAWYAVGLLTRRTRDDVDRAHRVMQAVAATQYDEPGTVWHGTFARFQEWPHPPADAREWEDYDPNWRQFVGTTFALLLADHGDAIDDATAQVMRAAIDLAVTGEPEGRVPAWYSNIALMKAWLDVEAGRVEEGEAFAEEVVNLFRRTGAFLEYGSPTYYGIDLFALALWRSRSSSERLRAWGEEVEAALWRDVARWYHAGLRNLCGPYARAYGMDMTSYAALLGLWVWEGLGRAAAPFPDIEVPFGHAHDLTMGPCVEALGARIPDDVVPALQGFDGERLLEQVVEPDLGLVATGWLGADVMAGGERAAASTPPASTTRPRCTGGHPTARWAGCASSTTAPSTRWRDQARSRSRSTTTRDGARPTRRSSPPTPARSRQIAGPSPASTSAWRTDHPPHRRACSARPAPSRSRSTSADRTNGV